MSIATAWLVFERAERMLKDLQEHDRDIGQQGFLDRLPYVLDLLAGVRRHINERSSSTPAFDEWWALQRTAEREAITELRHSSLKRFERPAQRDTFAQSFSSDGYWNGRRVASGDSVFVLLDWRFTDGPFADQEVLHVLTAHLEDLRLLLRDAERLLTQG